ncbi:DNA/RNA non-specific endonuclease [Thalassospira xiamenensis]|uniref:DNA/RNA non-specific endonuclease n=1 Tax=Thalassospira xiamenensis TaxID=220697 RepID=UPI0015F04BE6|nr:DNA/RNA non-specific endonuclease [Thalassospira xiamenensis]
MMKKMRAKSIPLPRMWKFAVQERRIKLASIPAIGFAVLILVLGTGTADAASRNCSKAEKQAADAQLLSIATDMDLQQQLRLRHAPFGLPLSRPASLHEQVLYQGGYIMAHDSDLMTSLWVSYSLSDQDIDQASGKDRVNCFRSDPRLKNGEGASTVDYREPVYDQGHMANDADLKDNLLQQINSYVMSNMSPQHCRFNRGICK